MKLESIIIVDDDEYVLRSMSKIFEKIGYTTERAKTGMEAINKVREKSFNIALLDLKLPDIEGTELSVSLKELYPEMEILIITGNPDLNSAVKALNIGASGYLLKPLNMDNLITTVKNIFEKQQLIEEKRKAKIKIAELSKFPSENPNPVLRATRVNVIYANKVAQELFKAQEQGILPEFLLEHVNAVLTENTAKSIEVELGNHTFILDIFPIKNENYLNIYGRDITERKKAFKKIEDLARFPSENPNPVLRVTKDRVNYANRVSQELFHTCQGEVIPELLRESVNKSLLEQTARDIEIEANNRVFSLIIIPIKDQDYVNIYGRDITKRKTAFKKIEDLARFPSENPNPVFRVDQKKVIFTNKISQNLFNIKKGSKIPDLLREVVNEAFTINNV